MAIATRTAATAFLVENPVPTNAETLEILGACVDINSVFDTIGLNTKQKLALIRQGVNSIPALRLLGETPDVVRTNLKAIVTLPVARGGTEFGLNVVTGLAAARKYFLDLKRTGSPLDPTLFDDNVLDEWVEKTLTPDDPDDDESPKLAPFNVDDFMSLLG